MLAAGLALEWPGRGRWIPFSVLRQNRLLAIWYPYHKSVS
jgi:hypothetical protein